MVQSLGKCTMLSCLYPVLASVLLMQLLLLYPGKQKIVNQVLESLTPKRETQMNVWAPGFGLLYTFDE